MKKLSAFAAVLIFVLPCFPGCSGSDIVDSPNSLVVEQKSDQKEAADSSTSAARKTDSSSEPKPQAPNDDKQQAPVVQRDSGDKKSLEALIALTEPAIVRIDVSTRDGGGIGSGFVIDDSGIVVTNHHVVDGATSAKVAFADGTVLSVAGVLGSDAKRDIAILRIQKDERKLASLKLRKDAPQKGQAVFAFGAPRGLSFSASEGIVSAIRSASELTEFGQSLEGEWIQTTTPISPGNSGGPLVDLAGQVVGINTFNIVKGQNLNFAVSASDIERIFENTKAVTPLPLSLNSNARNGLGGKEITSLKIPPKFDYRHGHNIESSKSKFDTYRRIMLGPIELNQQTALFIGVFVAENDRSTNTNASLIEQRVSDNAVFFINSVATGWRFRDRREMKILVDGERIDLGDMDREYEVRTDRSNVYCMERLSVPISLPLLLKIARAEEWDFAVGDVEHSFGGSLSLTAQLRDLLSRLPATKTTSGIRLEIDKDLEAGLAAVARREAEEATREEEELFRYELLGSSGNDPSRPLFRVKLLSDKAHLLRALQLERISRKVCDKREFTVWFYLRTMTPTERAWASATWTKDKNGPEIRFFEDEAKKKKKK